MWLRGSLTVPVAQTDNLEYWLYAWTKYFIWRPDPIPSFRPLSVCDPPQVSASSARLSCLHRGGVCGEVGALIYSLCSRLQHPDWLETGKGPKGFRKDLYPLLFDAASLISAYKDFLTYMRGKVVPSEARSLRLTSLLKDAQLSWETFGPAATAFALHLFFHPSSSQGASAGPFWSDTVALQRNRRNQRQSKSYQLRQAPRRPLR